LKLEGENIASAVLRDCSLVVDAGEIVTLRGRSGSGKTLLLRALADLDSHRGKVWLDGTEQAEMPAVIWRRRVRYVAAEAAWWSDRVGDHFMSTAGASRSLLELGMPADCMGWSVARLSTGEKQRLGFLRAIEDEPDVLLLDEPTAALDEASGQAVENMIERLRRGGAAILLVTHSEAQEARLGRRRYAIEAGRIREAS
jgi:ABC-type iron transport system FetAB ATPase subunit